MATVATTQALQPLEINGVEISIDALIAAIPPVPKELEARETVLEARGFTECKTAEDYELGADVFKRLRLLATEKIPGHYEPFRRLFYEPYTAVNEAKKKAVDAVVKEADRVNDLIVGWKRDEERKKREREEQIRRDQEAKRKAEIEEMNRKAQEEAAALEAAGKTQEAAQVIEEAVQVEQVLGAMPAVEVILPDVAPAARVTGTTIKTSYSAELVDLKALVEAAAKNWAAYGAFLQANQTGLNSMAKVQKEAFSVPGCKLVKKESLARTGR